MENFPNLLVHSKHNDLGRSCIVVRFRLHFMFMFAHAQISWYGLYMIPVNWYTQYRLNLSHYTMICYQN